MQVVCLDQIKKNLKRLRAVSCVSNVASICGLSINKYPLRFSLSFIATVLYTFNTFHNLAGGII
jgi:hypothetical protein